jgi:predicted secreted protein
MSDALNGKGTILKYAAGTEVGELTGITGPSMSGETIDVSNHESADGFREFISGMKDGGEISMEGNFIEGDAGQAALLASLISGAVESFVVLFTDGAQFAVSGIVTAFEPDAPFDGKISFSATIKVTGKPAFTAATTLRTVTFTVTATAGGAAIPDATIVFDEQTKTTNASGVAVFSNVVEGTKSYGITATGFVGEAAPVVVNGDEAVAVDLAAA